MITKSIDKVMKTRELSGPRGDWKQKYIVHGGETPWWEIEGRVERKKACKRQLMRMWNKLHPGASTETTRRFRKSHPEAAAEIARRYSENHPEAYAESIRRFKENHPGYATKAHRQYCENHPEAYAESIRRFKENHPEAAAESMRRYNEKHPGMRDETMRLYHKTPKGKAKLARAMSKHRERSTDPAMYALRVRLLHDLQESCAKCGAAYDISYQVDHIIPLCLSGTDTWGNLQPLCTRCHRKKSVEDLCMYMSTRGKS